METITIVRKKQGFGKFNYSNVGIKLMELQTVKVTKRNILGKEKRNVATNIEGGGG